MYEVTIDGQAVATFPSKYDADLYAAKIFTTRAARGKVVTTRRAA